MKARLWAPAGDERYAYVRTQHRIWWVCLRQSAVPYQAASVGRYALA